MTTTNSVGSTSAANALTSSVKSNTGLQTVNFDTFLKLLTAQLKNQDPLNPMDGTQFTGQIAQFSSLEQQINSNNYLKEILAQRDFGEQTLANSYIGRQVLGPGNLLVKDAATEDFGYKVGKNAQQVSIEIVDNKNGETVRTLRGEVAEGNHTMTWDGKNDKGVVADNGSYTVRIKSRDADGKVVASSTHVYGIVSGVLNEGGAVSLQTNDGRKFVTSDVLGVRL
jgi:flagellar basal-body rod modification protein FlgD